MITVYEGKKYSTMRFEDLKVGDTFIVNPVSIPDIADVTVYLKIHLQICGEDLEPCAVVLCTGKVIVPPANLPVIRVDSALNWKIGE